MWTTRCLSFMNSLIVPSPLQLCHLMFLDIFGPCTQPRAQERLRTAGLGFNMPDQRPRPRLEAPHLPGSVTNANKSLFLLPWLSGERLLPGVTLLIRLAGPSQCLPVGTGSVPCDHEMKGSSAQVLRHHQWALPWVEGCQRQVNTLLATMLGGQSRERALRSQPEWWALRQERGSRCPAPHPQTLLKVWAGKGEREYFPAFSAY